MKLEVGMYVRFKDKRGNTYIRKITKLANEYPQKLYGMEIDIEANYSEYLSLKNVLKASHNIIDLIEVGDYVNSYIVLDIIKDNLGKTYIECGCKDEIAYNYIYDTFYNEDIKSIVTKEQFEAIKYEIK